MFTLVEQQPKEEISRKTVTLVLNGQPDKSVNLTFKHQLKSTDIANALSNRFHFDSRTIRIFNREGVEFDREDLSYVKNSETLYISRGEEFDVNSCFSEYDIERLLGQGGFGRVDLCRHKFTGELVAIKHMRADRVETAQGIDIIFRETENLKALTHPNIVRILNFYAPKGLEVVFVMEYMEGGELLEYMRSKQRLLEEEAKTIMRQIVSAIAYCHFKNIVHRDLKLQNILLKQRGSLDIKVYQPITQIADFGISGVAQKVNPNVRSGTLKYMCPEVLSGNEKGNSPGVDVWAMGCILYHLVVGRLPFNGATPSEVVESILTADVIIPPELGLSDDCTSLIKRMLERDPKQRIRVPEIQDHSWIAKNKLFRMRVRKSQVRKSRVSMLKRKSQMIQLLLPINNLQLDNQIPDKADVKASPLEVVSEISQKRQSFRQQKSIMTKRSVLARYIQKDHPPVTLSGGRRNKAPLDQGRLRV